MSKQQLPRREFGKALLRDYGEGYIEGSWGRIILGEKRITKRGKSKEREKNIKRASRRAKANIRRKCMAAGLDHLLTLTSRENQMDKVKAWTDFEEFIRRVHSRIPDWKYVAVIEKQDRGALHFHLGVKGFQDIELLRSLWRSVVGEGNIDVQYKKSSKGCKWKRSKLASYLTKYIGKEMETELNERRFRASPGITLPGAISYFGDYWSARTFVLEKIKAIGGMVGFMWSPEESKGRYGWACSWG